MVNVTKIIIIITATTSCHGSELIAYMQLLLLILESCSWGSLNRKQTALLKLFEVISYIYFNQSDKLNYLYPAINIFDYLSRFI